MRDSFDEEDKSIRNDLEVKLHFLCLLGRVIILFIHIHRNMGK
jgi:hypothetical protein